VTTWFGPAIRSEPLTLRELLHTRNFARACALEDERILELPRPEPDVPEPDLPPPPDGPFGRWWQTVWMVDIE
jgi:hypothetical protein